MISVSITTLLNPTSSSAPAIDVDWHAIHSLNEGNLAFIE